MTPLLGQISAVIGTTPGPASGLTYKVKYTAPGGGVVETPPLVPANHHERPPDTVDVVAVPVATWVIGAEENGLTLFFFRERDDFGACGTTPPPPTGNPPPPDNTPAPPPGQ